MEQWIKDFQAKCSGTTITYNGTGSGAGVSNFIAKQDDFAGSDSALDPAKDEVAKATAACGSPALNLPMVTGPIAVAYKLNGVKDLTLTPQVITKIFLGKITTWDDPAIKAAQLRRLAALDQDHGVLPQRLLGHHPELREVPGRQRPGRLHQPSPTRTPPRPASRARARPARRASSRRSARPRAASATSNGPSRSAATSTPPRSTTAPARSNSPPTAPARRWRRPRSPATAGRT